MRILVTGGAGYIGSHCCQMLNEQGHELVVLDNLSRGHKRALLWGEFEQVDLNNVEALNNVFERYQIDAVIHFAAYAYVGESMLEPGLYFRNNVGGTLNLLDAMAAHGVEYLVFSSTCATYGEPANMPIVETTPQQPVNPYGESKLIVENMLRWYGEIHNLKWAALRYFNVAGSDPSGLIGENHDPEPHLVPLAIKAAIGRGPGLKIFGDDYPTPDGTAVRDYIHVCDLVDAHIKALDVLIKEQNVMKLNIGTGQGYSVQQVVDTVGHVMNKAVPHEIAPRRAGDPPELVSDPAQARELLSWHAQYDLEDMVRHAGAWLSANVGAD